MSQHQRKGLKNRDFIPQLLFNSAVTKAVIRDGVSTVPDYVYQAKTLADTIASTGKKVFGILLLNDQMDLLLKFVEADYLDAKLPFSVASLTKVVGLSDDEAGLFEQAQWGLISPTFRRSTINKRFELGTILPFVKVKDSELARGHVQSPFAKVKDDQLARGNFGIISVLRLCGEHQEVGDPFPEQFVRKKFVLDKFAGEENNLDKDQVEEDYLKELHNFSILNHLKHPNIIELLASYTLNGKHNLLFPLAKDGTLQKLLKTEREKTPFTSDATLLIALAGLASAVEHVHHFAAERLELKLMGCHHDLRPRNILVSGSTLILADFGLSNFIEVSDDPEPLVYTGTDDYHSPGKSGARASDMWSFGCIIAELVTYLVKGSEGVTDFRDSREYTIGPSTYTAFHKGLNEANPAVNAWLSNLENSRRKTKSCALLVWLTRETLRINESERFEAKDITWRVRLLALYEESAGIDELFQQSRADSNRGLDMVLEHARFEAWRDAAKTRDPEDMFKLPKGTPPYKTMDLFDSIIDCLKRLRSDLERRLSETETREHLDFSGLIHLNDELESFLSVEQNNASRRYFNIRIMDDSEQASTQWESGGTSGSISRDIRKRRAIKNMNRQIDKSHTSKSKKLLVNSEDVKLVRQVNHHDLGRLLADSAESQIWIEWRKYEKSGTDGALTEKLQQRTAAVAEFLAEPKPESFRTLKCRGYFHEPRRTSFGLIFELPEGRNADRLSNLNQEILRTCSSKTIADRPDLDDRYKLASSLAATVLNLHTAGWLHKSLMPSNIVFFPNASERSGALVREPFLVGFNHGRPGDPSTFTTGISDDGARDHLHPRYLKEGKEYLPKYDYYSLGIVLLEIGFWMPIQKLTAKLSERYEDRKQELVTKVAPLLRKYMGRGYFEAARYCIECDFGDSHHPEGKMKDTDHLLLFQEQVVGRLDKYLA